MRKDIIVDSNGQGRILRSWLCEQLPEIPTKGIRRAIQRGQITVDGHRVSSSTIIKKGQKVAIHIQDKFNSNIETTGIQVLYEDNDLAAIFKPEGIEIHGSHRPGIIGTLKQLLQPSNAEDALLNSVILHRLDKPTCGVILIAKSKRAMQKISGQFQQHKIQKQYLAISFGNINNEFTIDQPVDDKKAFTRVTLDQRKPKLSLDNIVALQVFPRTGRKHQIRRHLSSVGLPIAGDMKYGKQDDSFKHLLLCAESISFKHPNGSEMTINCQVPEYFGI